MIEETLKRETETLFQIEESIKHIIKAIEASHTNEELILKGIKGDLVSARARVEDNLNITHNELRGRKLDIVASEFIQPPKSTYNKLKPLIAFLVAIMKIPMFLYYGIIWIGTRPYHFYKEYAK